MTYECPLRLFDPYSHLVRLLPDPMGLTVPAWAAPISIGSIITIDVLFIGWAPSGPWEDRSFSLGVLGIFGLFFIYLGWFRWKFGDDGFVPWISLWSDVPRSGRLLLMSGLMTILITWSVIADSAFPPAGGLILNLIGSLLMLQGAYAILATSWLSEA